MTCTETDWAERQVTQVAQACGLAMEEVRRLVAAHTEKETGPTGCLVSRASMFCSLISH